SRTSSCEIFEASREDCDAELCSEDCDIEETESFLVAAGSGGSLILYLIKTGTLAGGCESFHTYQQHRQANAISFPADLAITDSHRKRVCYPDYGNFGL
ncbi:MAG TPA: hypothetical protein DIW81_30525, partial [Planctomycetaceae bacterium]|nr:hypothetical protein [Planctomycetaceae bacterium]